MMNTSLVTIAILLSMAWGKHFIIETEDTDNNDLQNIVMDDATNMNEEPIGTDYEGSVDCKWGDTITISDCQEERDKYEKYKKENNGTFLKKGCFFSGVTRILIDQRFEDVGKAYMNELAGTIKKIRKSKKRWRRKDSLPQNIKAFQKLRQEANEDDAVDNILYLLEDEYEQEIRKIKELMKTRYLQFPTNGRIQNFGKEDLCRHTRKIIKDLNKQKASTALVDTKLRMMNVPSW